MTTNEIKINDINYKNLFQKYSLFLITSNILDENIFSKSCIIDSIQLSKQQFSVLSVVYSKNKFCLAMLKKTSTCENSFINYVCSEFPQFDVNVISLADCENDFFRNKYFEKNNRLLFKLLINSINSFSDSYNNLTGNLYYKIPGQLIKSNNQIIGQRLLQIDITPDMHMALNIRTFRLYTKELKENKKHYTEFVIDPITNQLRRALKSDENIKERFIRKRFKKKAHIDAISIKSLKSFEKSKMGILTNFINDFKERFGNIIDFDFVEYPSQKYTFPKNIKTYELNNYKTIIQQQGIALVNLIPEALESEEIINKIAQTFDEDFEIHVELENEIQPNKFNIVLIYDNSHYTEDDDPYKNLHSNNLVQVITYDSLSKSIFIDEDDLEEESISYKAIVDKIIKELCIKRELKLNKVELVQIDKIIKEPWTFVSIYSEIDDDSNKRNIIFYRLKLYPDGTFELDNFTNSLTKDFEKLRLITLANIYFSDESSLESGEKLEGFFYKNILNIHTIIKTSLYTLPNFNNIKDVLIKTQKTNLIDIKILKKGIEEFTTETNNSLQWKDNVLSVINNSTEAIKNSDLNKAINVKSAIGCNFNRWFYEHYNILINPEFKNADFEQKFNWNNVLDIQLFNKDFQGIQNICYIAGKDRTGKTSFNKSLTNFNIVRRIYAETENQFSEILPFLKVSFIRPNSNTVLPFPFKYLREYTSSL